MPVVDHSTAAPTSDEQVLAAGMRKPTRASGPGPQPEPPKNIPVNGDQKEAAHPEEVAQTPDADGADHAINREQRQETSTGVEPSQRQPGRMHRLDSPTAQSILPAADWGISGKTNTEQGQEHPPGRSLPNNPFSGTNNEDKASRRTFPELTGGYFEHSGLTRAIKPINETRTIAPPSGERAHPAIHSPVLAPEQISPQAVVELNAPHVKSSLEPSQAAGGQRMTIHDVLDAGTRTNIPVWTHTQRNLAEAGFEDPAIGWVRVRAQADAVGIHAAVVPASSDARETLGGHLSGLGMYLSEHHAPVDTWTLAAPEAAPRQGSAMNTGDGETGRGGHQDHEASGHQERTAATTVDRDVPAETAGRRSTMPVVPSRSATQSGAHISLIA